jgi:SAM-dependent methyltransferase
MSAEVLQNRMEIKTSRAEMRTMGIDCMSSNWSRFLHRLGLTNEVIVGDFSKSWDILKTIKFVHARLSSEAPILDIGAHTSEVLCSLHRLGHTQLAGVDLRRDLVRMPYANKITYVISDFMHMPFEASSYSAVTAISVIEHGFQAESLLAELSRVLKPGGYFIASVDYWPGKINTNGVRAFDMDWRIFSEDEVRAFFKSSERYGFSPLGDINLTASKPIISWQGKHYTFAWFVLQKKDS